MTRRELLSTLGGLLLVLAVIAGLALMTTLGNTATRVVLAVVFTMSVVLFGLMLYGTVRNLRAPHDGGTAWTALTLGGLVLASMGMLAWAIWGEERRPLPTITAIPLAAGAVLFAAGFFGFWFWSMVEDWRSGHRLRAVAKGLIGPLLIAGVAARFIR